MILKVYRVLGPTLGIVFATSVCVCGKPWLKDTTTVERNAVRLARLLFISWCFEKKKLC